MKLKLFTVIAVLAGLATASGNPEEGKGKKHRGHAVIKQLIEKFDKDGDGKLDEAERKAAGEARKAEFLKKFDKDGDGKISADEKKAIAEQWKGRRGPRPEGRRGHRPEGGKPEGRKPRPEGRKPRPDRKPEGRKPRPDRKPGRKPAPKK